VGDVGVAGHLVSYGTLEGTRGGGYASLGCRTPGQMMREGGLALSGSVTESPYTPRAVLAVRLGTKCRRVQTLVRFCS
jgi:hypothetical protein